MPPAPNFSRILNRPQETKIQQNLNRSEWVGNYGFEPGNQSHFSGPVRRKLEYRQLNTLTSQLFDESSVTNFLRIIQFFTRIAIQLQ